MTGPSGEQDAPPPTEHDAPPPTSHRRPTTRPAILSRRSLLGAGVVLVAGGVGAGIAGIQPRRERAAHVTGAPTELAGALARELSLVANLEATLRHDPSRAVELRAARDDHAAHATALRSAISAYPTPSMSSTPPASGPPAAPTIAQLHAAELAAARSAAAESSALTGADAALLASISACEATHAELIT